MAESVDALVSNTNIARCAGSTPALGSQKQLLRLFFYFHNVAAVYILFSNRINRFYIGSCLNLDERLDQHKNRVFPDSFTSVADDWELFLSFENLEYNHARAIEMQIKKMKSSKYIRNLKLYEDLRNKLINTV